jgi:ABC-type glutathione transport system ATPase component
MHATEPLIEISELYHAYEGSGTEPINALRGVSLAVRPGEFVAI